MILYFANTETLNPLIIIDWQKPFIPCGLSFPICEMWGLDWMDSEPF